MYSHVTLGTADLIRARAFYEPLFQLLGQVVLGFAPDDGYLMLGPSGDAFPHTFVCHPFDGQAPEPGNGFHVAYMAEGKSVVDRFHETALALGGTDEGAPGLRPHYDADYYAAFVRDLDGNKLQVVHYGDGRRWTLSSESQVHAMSHVTVGASDLARSDAFYRAVLAPLGVEGIDTPSERVIMRYVSPGTQRPLFVAMRPFDGALPTPGNGPHCAFHATTRAAVHAFHEAALSAGGTCDGPPGPRPHYSPVYYAAYIRDADGNKIQAVCRAEG